MNSILRWNDALTPRLSSSCPFLLFLGHRRSREDVAIIFQSKSLWNPSLLASLSILHSRSHFAELASLNDAVGGDAEIHSVEVLQADTLAFKKSVQKLFRTVKFDSS